MNLDDFVTIKKALTEYKDNLNKIDYNGDESMQRWIDNKIKEADHALQSVTELFYQ